MKKLRYRTRVPAEEVDEILFGSVGIAGMLTRSRHYIFEAGLPFSISATDMNKQCGSSLPAATLRAFAGMRDMGATAEKAARERGISREDADRFSLESHRKAIRAQKEGLLAGEIQPAAIGYSDG